MVSADCKSEVLSRKHLKALVRVAVKSMSPPRFFYSLFISKVVQKISLRLTKKLVVPTIKSSSQKRDEHLVLADKKTIKDFINQRVILYSCFEGITLKVQSVSRSTGQVCHKKTLNC